MAGLSGLSGLSAIYGGESDFSPADIDNLVLWLRADKGTFQDVARTVLADENNDPVGGWTDQSGQGNHAAVVAGNDAFRPAYKTNVQNSKPTAQFDGANGRLTCGEIDTYTDGLTIFVVAKAAAAANQMLVSQHNSGSDGSWFLAGTAAGYLQFSTITASRVNYSEVYDLSTDLHIITAHYDSAKVHLYVDGFELGTGVSQNGDIKDDNRDVFVSDYTYYETWAWPWTQHVAEVLVYRGSLSTAEIQQVEEYLSDQWMLPLNRPRALDVGSEDFTVVYITDTQYLSASAPANFNALTQWIADNETTLNIQMVLHEGDIVDDAGIALQWDRAVTAMATMADVPHLIGIGNRAYDNIAVNRDTTEQNARFGPLYYTGKSWWVGGGFYEAGKTENSYLPITIRGIDYLFINLEFGPRQEVVDWAKTLIGTTFSDHEVIMMTHCYMLWDDTRVGTGDPYNPHTYAGVGAHPGGHDADELWDELLKLYENMLLVSSGHELSDGRGFLDSVGDEGNTVHQFLSNYQWLGLSGYVLIVQVRRSIGRIDICTYSPDLDTYRINLDEYFVIDY